MLMSKTIFFSGGGTSGHINPALAIAEELKQAHPEVEIVFCGTQSGLESDIVPRAGYRFEVIRASGLPRKLGRQLLTAWQDFQAGKKQAAALIKQYRPAVVVGTGGYVCGPVLAAAKKAKVPILIHEQNAYPGRSNRLMSKGAETVCISYEQTRSYFKQAKKVVLTGNPVRGEYWSIDKEKARNKLGLTSAERLILATGGSRGARTINRSVVEFMRQNPELDATVILVSGKDLYSETQALAADLTNERFIIQDYLYDMPYYMAAADLLICRAGAITCAEVAALGKAAAFIPYPFAASDHQTYNARAFSDIGAGLLCPDSELSGGWLSENVLPLLFDEKKRETMETAVKALAKPRATQDIVRELEILLER